MDQKQKSCGKNNTNIDEKQRGILKNESSKRSNVAIILALTEVSQGNIMFYHREAEAEVEVIVVVAPLAIVVVVSTLIAVATAGKK